MLLQFSTLQVPSFIRTGHFLASPNHTLFHYYQQWFGSRSKNDVRCKLMTVQSAFTAFNIEPEEDNEDEIDDSKEIQVRRLDAAMEMQNLIKSRLRKL